MKLKMEIYYGIYNHYICQEEGVWCLLKIKQIKKIIFLHLIGGKVYKIDALTGKIEKGFGNKGFIESFTLVAPLIYTKKLIIVSPNTVNLF